MAKEDGIIRGKLTGEKAREYDKSRLIDKVLSRKDYGGRRLRKQEVRRKIIHLGDMLVNEDNVK